MACKHKNCYGYFDDILGARNVSEAQEFPRIRPKDLDHYVLYKVEDRYRGTAPPEPYRVEQQFKWDSNHVKMPFDARSTYHIYERDGSRQTVPRWQVIQDALIQPINNTDDLINAIKSYNGQYRDRWTFPALKKFIRNMSEAERSSFFDKTIKKMAALALEIETLFQAPIPLLKRGQNKAISMTQQQIASIMANAFFCTFPNRNSSRKDGEYASYPYINFSPMFESRGYEDLLAKLKCLINYFNRVVVEVPTGVVTFVRRYVRPQDCPDWERSSTRVEDLYLHVDCQTRIEDAHGLIQLDFANKYLGGGVIGHGSVQEEIRFVTCPELMASMLFTEVLDDTEAVMIIGSERYSKYTGYSRSFRFDGNYVDDTPYDSSGRRKCAVLAIDAKPYSSSGHESNRTSITRELNKAWVGFSFYGSRRERDFPGVATGNWGCGAFGGSKPIKSLIQLMACAEARRPMAYYTFHDCELLEGIASVFDSIKFYNITVGQLYTLVVEKFVKADPKTRNLKSFNLRNQDSNNHVQPYSRSSGGDSYQEEPEEGSDAHEEQVAKTSNSSAVQDSTPVVSRKTRSVHCDSDTEPGQEEISDAILKKFIDNSPDLFSQDEYQDPTDLQTDKPETGGSKRDQTIEPKSEKKMADGDKLAGSKRTSNHTSRLFDEMQKFDDVNGTLNLSMSSIEKKSVLNDADSPMDVDKTTESPEVKKKISGKKITDYFSKI